MSTEKNTTSKYSALGSSADKSGMHAALNKAGIGSKQRFFSQVFPDFSADNNFFSFLHCDGAGTKSIVAYLMYRATGSPQWFAGLAQDALVMNLDDIFCLGIPESLGLANLIARNYNLIPDECLSPVLNRYRELSLSLADHGICINLCGGETADCGDVVRTLLVDAVMSGRIRKSSIIDPDRIAPGDVIVGMSSTGQATYETAFNSGISSNGMTLARHALLSLKKITSANTVNQTNSESVYAEDVTDVHIPEQSQYTGPYAVDEYSQILQTSVGESLLSPTRTYAPVLVDIYQALAGQIHGAIHCTGGGQTKVLRFGKGNLYIKDNLFPVPPLFKMIQEHGNVSWEEMYKVFNMGHRFELYLPEEAAKSALEICNRFNIDAKIIGRVEPNPDSSENNVVKINSTNGVFQYKLR